MCSALHKRSSHGHRNQNRRLYPQIITQSPSACLNARSSSLPYLTSSAYSNLQPMLRTSLDVSPFVTSSYLHTYLFVHPMGITSLTQSAVWPLGILSSCWKALEKRSTSGSRWSWWIYSCSFLVSFTTIFLMLWRENTELGQIFLNDYSISWAWVPRCLSRRPTSLTGEISPCIQYHSLITARPLWIIDS